jgi:hypothetical protein
LHERVVDLTIGWARMRYGPPVHTTAIDAVEMVGVLHREHPEARRRAMPREVFATYPVVTFRRKSTPDVFDLLVTAATGPPAQAARDRRGRLAGRRVTAILRRACSSAAWRR